MTDYGGPSDPDFVVVEPPLLSVEGLWQIAQWVAVAAGPLALGGAPGGLINLPAMMIALLVTILLIIGTSESAKFNAVLVMVKLVALAAFLALTYTSSEFSAAKFNPFLPAGVFGGFGQFEGTMEVTSSGGEVSSVALRYDNPGGTVFATYPVIPLP